MVPSASRPPTGPVEGPCKQLTSSANGQASTHTSLPLAPRDSRCWSPSPSDLAEAQLANPIGLARVGSESQSRESRSPAFKSRQYHSQLLRHRLPSPSLPLRSHAATFGAIVRVSVRADSASRRATVRKGRTARPQQHPQGFWLVSRAQRPYSSQGLARTASIAKATHCALLTASSLQVGDRPVGRCPLALAPRPAACLGHVLRPTLPKRLIARAGMAAQTRSNSFCKLYKLESDSTQRHWPSCRCQTWGCALIVVRLPLALEALAASSGTAIDL